ncbi:MAG: hypothetical protein V4764_05670 [Burkholderia sp.]
MLDAAYAPPPSETLRRSVTASFACRPSAWTGRHPWWSVVGLAGIASTGCISGFVLMSRLIFAPDSLDRASRSRDNSGDKHHRLEENES